MKKKLPVLFFCISCFLQSYSQNWLIYNTSNSNSPYNTYIRMAIDTANHKCFDWRNSAGDQTIFFDNDTTWQTKNNVYMTGTYNTRTMLIDKKNVLWECSFGNRVYSLANISVSWQAYDGTTTGAYPMYAVLDLAVDSKNNKWFGGYNGLAKYNDTVFTAMDTTSHTLPFEPVAKIATDKFDNVWIIGGSNKLAKYDGSSWQVFTTPFTATNTYKMIADSNGYIWLGQGAFGGGMYKFDGSSWTNYNTGNSGIPTNVIGALAVDKNNYIWISYVTGLTRFDGTAWTNYDAAAGYPGGTTGYPTIEVDKLNNKWNCSGNGVVVFNETGIVGVDEINKQMGAINLYPNPVNDRVTISFESDDAENVTVFIMNTLGQTIKANETHKADKGKNELQIDVAFIPKGIYFIEVKSNKGMITKKFIKQ